MKRIVLGILLVALGAFLLSQSFQRSGTAIACGDTAMTPDGPPCTELGSPPVSRTYAELRRDRDRMALAYLGGGGVALILAGGVGVSGLHASGLNRPRRRAGGETAAVGR